MKRRLISTHRWSARKDTPTRDRPPRDPQPLNPARGQAAWPLLKIARIDRVGSTEQWGLVARFSGLLVSAVAPACLA